MKREQKSIKIVSLKMVQENRVKYNTPITDKFSVKEICKPFLENAAIEKVVIIGLDAQNKPNVIHIFTGATEQCGVYPSTIMKILLLSNCLSFIMAHNHPAGSMSASGADKAFTKKLKEAGELLSINMLDSVIFNPDMSEMISLRENTEW